MKIEIDLTSVFDALVAEVKKANAPKRKPKESAREPEDQRCSELTMRLMALANTEDDVENVALELDVASYIKDLLASGKKKEAVTFLNDNKHRFTPDMKDSLTNVINEGL